MIEMEHGIILAAALMIGVVIGLERGWNQRAAEEGERVAGLRTFALVALTGGVAGLLSQESGLPLLAIALAAIAGLIVLGYRRLSQHSSAYGITTEVAALLTFLLGALAARGEPLLAMAGGVVTAVLLGFKPRLHALLNQLDAPELRAILQLALISAVILPFLPRQGYGPWQVLNPYELWLMVVLISTIGFVGHFAVRIAGAQRGILLTGLFAGLASSTALTLTLARAAREQREFQTVFAAAVVLASTTMFPRVLVIVGVLQPALVQGLLIPLGLMTAAGVLATLVLALLAGRVNTDSVEPPLQKPFALATALRFGLLLAVVMLLAEGLRRAAGDTGIYTVAILAGLTDVDAITLSLLRMTEQSLSTAVATQGIILASIANTGVKLGLAVGIGRGRMAVFCSAGLGAVMISAGLWLWLG